MFVSRGDRDLGVAFLMHPGSQSLSRGEAKDSALLSSCDGYLLEPTEWPKGPPPCLNILSNHIRFRFLIYYMKQVIPILPPLISADVFQQLSSPDKQ